MKIAISLLNFRPGHIGGTETYLRSLVTAMSSVAGEHEVVLVVDRDLAATDLFPGYQCAVVPLSARQVLAHRALEALTPFRSRTVEQTLNSLHADAVLFPQQAIFPKTVESPCAMVVHDLYHIFYPQYLSHTQRMHRKAIFPYSLQRADRIIAISGFTARTVRETYPAVADKVVTVPHGFHHVLDTRVDAIPGVPQPYIYYPAATLPHKNHVALFRAVAALRAQGQFNRHLVLSGLQTRFGKTLDHDIRRLKIEDLVIQLGYLPYDGVWRLYRGAECVVFPSLFEGFGLPVCEAAAFHKKIIVSRLEVFDELGVPRRFQIDFNDPQQLRQALAEPGHTVLERSPWTWEECAAVTLEHLVGSTTSRQTDHTPWPRLFAPEAPEMAAKVTEGSPLVGNPSLRAA